MQSDDKIEQDGELAMGLMGLLGWVAASSSHLRGGAWHVPPANNRHSQRDGEKERDSGRKGIAFSFQFGWFIRKVNPESLFVRIPMCGCGDGGK